MPRANRYFLPGLVWHLTHRCHKREFLLKFARDRYSYLRWLYEARKRFGFCVLDYMITANHVHLLVKDTGEGTIARSMQLIAGRTAQQYNRRKARPGAFWEDRYHATAVEADVHLHRCLVYIDLNMVRAGVVRHPAQWPHSGYREIHQPPERYRIIDLGALSRMCGFDEVAGFQQAHRQWVEAALREDRMARDDRWSESIAVGSQAFVKRVKAELGLRVKDRRIAQADAVWTLRELAQSYGSHFDRGSAALRLNNTVPWVTNLEITEA
jgi:putative transposase